MIKELHEDLLKNGFNAKYKKRSDTILVKLGGLSNPVHISNDYTLNRFILKTYDYIHGLLGSIILLYSLYSKSGLGNISFIIAALFFLTVILTEIKVLRLREFIEQVNRGRNV